MAERHPRPPGHGFRPRSRTPEGTFTGCIAEQDPEDLESLDTEAFLVRADASGHFESTEVPSGHTIVFARSEGSEPQVVGWTSVAVGTGRPVQTVLQLARGGEISGTLMNGDGQAYSDYLIQAQWEGNDELSEMEKDVGQLFGGQRVRTDERGNFRLTGLFPGDYDLTITSRSGTERLQHELALAAGEHQRWDPVLATRGDLQLLVTGPDGKPLPRWRVGVSTNPGWLRQSEFMGETNRDGELTIHELPMRAHQISLYRPSGAADEDSITRKLPCRSIDDVYPSTDPLRVQLRQQELATGSVELRWLDAHGQPRAGARIALSQEGWQERSRLQTDDDGRLSIEGLTARRFTLTSAERTDPQGSVLAEFELGPDQQRDLGDLSLPAPALLSLTLHDTNGEPVTKAKVALTRWDAPAGPPLDGYDNAHYRVLHDRGEGFEPTPFSADRYTLHASAQGYAPTWTEISLEAGARKDLALTLQRGVRQRFHLFFPQGGSERPIDETKGRVDVFIHDANGRLTVDERLDGPLEPAGYFQVEVPLHPGAYSARLVDHRRGLQVHAEGSLEFEVRTSMADPIRVQLAAPR